jgi:hypothetical protein
MLIPFVIAVPMTYSANGFRICSRYVAAAAGVLRLTFRFFLVDQIGFVDGLFHIAVVWVNVHHGEFPLNTTALFLRCSFCEGASSITAATCSVPSSTDAEAWFFVMSSAVTISCCRFAAAASFSSCSKGCSN